MKFSFEQLVPLARESAFGFFENPKRLELLHEGWSRVKVLECEPRVRVGGETWVETRIARVVPLMLGFRHTLFEPPCRFGEEIIHGPFSRFTHIHEFLAEEEGTIVRDLLDIQLPWRYGGEIVIRYAVAPSINGIFRHRAEALMRLIHNGEVAVLREHSCRSRQRLAVEKL